ncbi:MAG: hypothetical protein ACPLVJ_00030 [Candidatus Bathyarchaeales archaeon]
MNVVETFVLFVIMMVVFVLFGLIGLLVLGFIIAVAYLKTRKVEEEAIHLKLKKSGRQQRKQSSKPCYPHGLVNCPFCYPNVEDSTTEEDSASSYR